MDAAAEPAEAERTATDHAAIRLMLSYVEAECRRMGATDAARHAALAAALMPDPAVVPPPRGSAAPDRNGRLH